MPIVDISALPAAPSRRQSPADFVAAADAHVAALTPMVAQLNAAFDQVEAAEASAIAKAAAAAGDSAAAATARAAAQASAELAAGYAGAAAWVAATVYPKDAVVFSPVNRMLYRRKAAGASPGDPSADAANWDSVVLQVGGNAVWHAGNFNPATKADLANANFTALQVGGNSVWHAGNFNPATKADLAAANFTVLSVGGKAVWHTGNFNPASYAPLAGGGLFTGAGSFRAFSVRSSSANSWSYFSLGGATEPEAWSIGAHPLATAQMDAGSVHFQAGAAGTVFGISPSAGPVRVVGDYGRLFSSRNTSAGGAVQFYVDHALGNVQLGNLRGNLQIGAGGSIELMREFSYAGQNSGNSRAIKFGYSGGNYGGLAYGVDFTGTTNRHTYALSDAVTLMHLADGLVVQAAPAGTIGSDVAWSDVLVASRTGVFRYRGNDVWHAGNVDPFRFVGWIANPGADANTLAGNRSSFTYGNNAPWSGPLVHFDAGGYGLQLHAAYGGGSLLAFRTRNGDGGVWNPWRGVWHEGNFQPSQYAALAANSTFDGFVETRSHFYCQGDYYVKNGASWWNVIQRNGGLPHVYANSMGFSATMDIVDSSTRLSRGSSNSFRMAAPTGYCDVGSMNADFFHFQTDRPRFYFNKSNYVSGRVYANSDGSDNGIGLGSIKVSTAAPSGGVQGDIWVMY